MRVWRAPNRGRFEGIGRGRHVVGTVEMDSEDLGRSDCLGWFRKGSLVRSDRFEACKSDDVTAVFIEVEVFRFDKFSKLDRV